MASISPTHEGPDEGDYQINSKQNLTGDRNQNSRNGLETSPEPSLPLEESQAQGTDAESDLLRPSNQHASGFILPIVGLKIFIPQGKM